MNVDRLQQLFGLHGLETRVRRDEVILHVCPYCGNDRWNLEASSAKGVYNCWACPASGSVASLLADLGIAAPEDLEVRLDESSSRYAETVQTVRWPAGTRPAASIASAAAYLRRRGLSEAEIGWFDVGVRARDDDVRVVFPLREYWSGRAVGWVARAYAPLARGPKYLAEVSCPDSLPGWRADRPTARAHVIVEGVFDALAVRRAGAGAAMLLGVAREEEAVRWAARVPEDEVVGIMLDPGAERTARGLYHAIRSFRDAALLRLPEGTDPGDASVETLTSVIEEALA